MADEPREFIPKDSPEGDRMLVFELASKDEQAAGPPPNPPPEDALPLAREPRPKGSRKGLLLGVAGAVALGAVLGVVARPDLIGEPAKMQPARPPAEVTAPTIPQVQVMVRDQAEGETAAAPAPPPEDAPETQVATAPQARPSQPRAAEPPPPRLRPPAQVAIAPVRPPEPPPRSAPAPRDPPREAPLYASRTEPAPPRARPSFDCRYASTRSEELVCADPQLAAADRRLARAYEQAIAAGVPRRYLRAEQDDWLAIREEAARRSPRAVANIYDQRTAELNDMAIEARQGF
jgi:uncharacterized protein YecT (DUF1311 family)